MKLRKLPIDSTLVVGALISLILSLIAFIISTEIITSTIICLLGIIITIQIDQIARIEQGLKKNTQYSQLWEKMEDPDWLFPLINEIADSTKSIISNNTNEHFSNNTKSEIEKCRNHLQDLARGRMLTDYTDSEPVISAVKNAKLNIYGVSISNVDMTYWYSGVGKRFWTLNLKAAEANVKVERVFVYEKMVEPMRKIIEQQANANKNIHIYTIQREDVPADLRIDMTIVDNVFMYEAVLNSDGVPIQNLYSVNISEINRNLTRFNMIKNLSEEYHPETNKGN